jgi:hypothetical protein
MTKRRFGLFSSFVVLPQPARYVPASQFNAGAAVSCRRRFGDAHEGKSDHQESVSAAVASQTSDNKRATFGDTIKLFLICSFACERLLRKQMPGKTRRALGSVLI